MSNFREGDVVQLKSGSPALTVIGFSEGARVNVSWYDDKEGVFKFQLFLPSALALVPAYND